VWSELCHTDNPLDTVLDVVQSDFLVTDALVLRSLWRIGGEVELVLCEPDSHSVPVHPAIDEEHTEIRYGTCRYRLQLHPVKAVSLPKGSEYSKIFSRISAGTRLSKGPRSKTGASLIGAVLLTFALRKVSMS
jgi:hypothetical protein